ncbi:MAG: hypothetical protein OXU42_03960 [Deltaproteobacteria bacterium]|nr:hypothetical protein [Deltaproteobacteria bacterium]
MFAERLLRLATEYAKRRGITLSTVGTYAAGHGNFFPCLSAGRVTIRRAEKVLQYLSDHWPDDLRWPSDIDRPEPTAKTSELGKPGRAD